MSLPAACRGRDRLEPIADDQYRATLTLAVASISGRYTGTVSMLDKNPAALVPPRRRRSWNARVRQG